MFLFLVPLTLGTASVRNDLGIVAGPIRELAVSQNQLGAADVIRAIFDAYPDEFPMTADSFLTELDNRNFEGITEILKTLELSTTITMKDRKELVSACEAYTGRPIRVHGTVEEFEYLMQTAHAMRLHGALQSQGSAVEITEKPLGEVECPNTTMIKGMARGGEVPGQGDFILVLDSSASLVNTDPQDFRLAGANALADALTSAHRLALIDFDAPEIRCQDSACPNNCRFYPCDHTNQGTEVESCFLDPVADAALIDKILTPAEFDKLFGGTSFNSAAEEILNAYKNCPSPTASYSCTKTYCWDSYGCPSFDYWICEDTNRLGHFMPAGAAPRSGIRTKITWFTDGDNTIGCDVTADQIASIKAMDSDGVTVDVVKLGPGLIQGPLAQLVKETGGQIFAVSDPQDLVDAILQTVRGKIVTIEAFNESAGDVKVPVQSYPLPAVEARFTVVLGPKEAVPGKNVIRIEATDEEGKIAVAKVDFLYVDKAAPVLSGCPGDESLECEAVPAPANVTASDACEGDTPVVFEETETPGKCKDNYTVLRTWKSTDGSGNSSTCFQTVMVEDTEPPVLAGVSADATAECDAVPAEVSPAATDNCDAAPRLDFTEVRTDGNCPNNYALTRTWTATDNCANKSTSLSQVVTVRDSKPPALQCDFEQVSADENPDEGSDESIDGLYRVTYSGTDTCDPAPAVQGYVDVYGNDETCDNKTPGFDGYELKNGDLVRLNCSRDVHCIRHSPDDETADAGDGSDAALEITGPAMNLIIAGLDSCRNNAGTECFVRCPNPEGCIDAVTLRNSRGEVKTFYWWEFGKRKTKFDVGGELGTFPTDCSECLKPNDPSAALTITCIEAGKKLANKCKLPEGYFSKPCP
jgi:hypothetical protein